MKKTMCLYGNTKIPRGYCNKCQTTAMIVKGQMLCCDTPVDDSSEFGKKVLRISNPECKRKRPSRMAIWNMTVKQDNRCLYCDIPFETAYVHPKYKKIMTTRACCDHVVPYKYSQDNRDINFVLACGTCNGIKSDLMFNSLEDARDYVRHRREKKGYKEEIYIL